MHQHDALCVAFLMFSVGAAWADPPKLPVQHFLRCSAVTV